MYEMHYTNYCNIDKRREQPYCLNVEYDVIAHGFRATTTDIDKVTCYVCKERLAKVEGNKFYERNKRLTELVNKHEVEQQIWQELKEEKDEVSLSSNTREQLTIEF